ncbi:Hypothetical predicted protein [Podarcis lilfordi]|uniref:Uncharacterized protein n=1 Tax=Podarcis lilfordi TaxID=74358 RepID=A0AA35K955_9SAUR|nr:Hypothetical predicted protein [Podarcis lilfordi]
MQMSPPPSSVREQDGAAARGRRAGLCLLRDAGGTHPLCAKPASQPASPRNCLRLWGRREGTLRDLQGTD